jgi:protein SCO1/2
MKPVGKPLKFIGLAIILFLPIIIFFLLSRGDHYFNNLPHYGIKIPTTKEVNGIIEPDTIYHEIPFWSFTNQDGKTVTQEDYDGKIYVADFIFTTCPTICPKMTTQMSLLQLKLDNPAFNDIGYVSYTVDPEHDTPDVLKEYGNEHGADFNRWTFLTGEKQKIYELGVYGYLVSAQEDVLAPGGFLHSEKFILVDWNRNIRGFYDGTDVNDVGRLAEDIKILLKEKSKL